MGGVSSIVTENQPAGVFELLSSVLEEMKSISGRIDGIHDRIDAMEGQDAMTTKEAAKFIPCSEKKIYHLVSADRIPHQKVGRGLSFSKADLAEWKRNGGAVTPA